MKAAMLLVLPCVAVAMQASGEEVARLSFAAFKKQFNKVYASAEEEAARFAAFQASLDRVAASGNPAHGITQFSDLTPAEFKARYTPGRLAESQPTGTYGGECPACKRFPEARANVSAWDWTQKGAVTRVKNQGQCGSCWSFGTTGDIEGTWFLAGNRLVELSEQELVSCGRDGVDNACGGGLQEYAFKWVIKNGGLVTEQTYPYRSGDGIVGRCQSDRMSPVAAKIRSWYQVSKAAYNESTIEEQLPRVGPITIGIDAGPMQDYHGGIDNPRNCRNSRNALDHAVMIVGFGEDARTGVKYWKIKNSWGASWGEEGYYRIVRGENKCGLAMDAVHSVV